MTPISVQLVARGDSEDSVSMTGRRPRIWPRTEAVADAVDPERHPFRAPSPPDVVCRLRHRLQLAMSMAWLTDRETCRWRGDRARRSPRRSQARLGRRGE